MGLFNFWKDKGEEVIEANQSAAEDIRTHILSNNPGVTELRVGYEDGVVKLGGTLSGEHGVGLEKRDFIDRELDPAALGLMHAIKRQFDPNGVLNPGKALPIAERR